MSALEAQVSRAARAWQVLEAVPDPEIPVVSIRELGILREINEHDHGRLEVVITPTYSGCPAMGQIEDDVRAALAANGIDADVVMRLAPAWSNGAGMSVWTFSATALMEAPEMAIAQIVT